MEEKQGLAVETPNAGQTNVSMGERATETPTKELSATEIPMENPTETSTLEKKETQENKPVPAAENKPAEQPKKKDKPKKKDELIVPANKKGEHIIPFMNFLRVIFLPFFWLLCPFRFYGNKVKNGACIYVCNHYTLFDCAYVAATTWEGIHIISKRENLDNPFLGWFARRIKAIPANRDGKDVKTLRDSIRCLKNNQKICIFPEGTRNKTDAEMLPFHHGAALMAIMSKKPIVPIMIYEKPRMFKCAHILVGDPIELTEYYDRKLTARDYEEADNKIREIMLEMRRKHKEELESKKKKK